MNLLDRVKSAYVGVIGNRFTLAGSILYGSSTGIMYTTENNENNSLLWGMNIAGVILCGFTKFGSQTAKFYKATDNHIRRKGTLQEHVAKKWIENFFDGSILGYCQLQGIYLAAKKHGQENLFFDYKEKYSSNKMGNW